MDAKNGVKSEEMMMMMREKERNERMKSGSEYDFMVFILFIGEWDCGHGWMMVVSGNADESEKTERRKGREKLERRKRL